MAEEKSLSGLTEEEAIEFHKIFTSSFAAFIVVAVVAHVLAWAWRPFWPGPQGWVQSALDTVTTFLA
jgi:light-harvesting complex 1 beta chain